MPDIGIAGIASYIPSQKLTNDDLVKRLEGVEESFLKDKIGIVARSVAAKDEAASDLACRALENLLAKNPEFSRDEIDLLVVVTQNPDYKLPHTAALVQHRLKLPKLASFDLNLGCSGFVYALAVAKGMMDSMNFNNAVILTADIYSKILDPLDKNTVTLFGDAGAAVWLKRNTSNRLMKFTMGTDGSGYENLIIKDGGSRSPSLGSGKDSRLHMDGRKVYNFMMTAVPADIKNCLELNGLTAADVDFFVFHQASKFMLESLAGRLDIPLEKVIFYMEECGNTVSSSVPLAMEHLLKTHDPAGKTVLVSGFGVGLSWATGIIQFK